MNGQDVALPQGLGQIRGNLNVRFAGEKEESPGVKSKLKLRLRILSHWKYPQKTVSPLGFRVNGTRISTTQINIISCSGVWAESCNTQDSKNRTAIQSGPSLCPSDSDKDLVTYICLPENSSMAAGLSGQDPGGQG